MRFQWRQGDKVIQALDLLSTRRYLTIVRPRLFGTVEVRTPAGNAISAAYVSLGLYCHENVAYRPENRSSLTTQKQTKTTIIGKEVLLWQAPDGRSHEDIMSLNLPFMLPFPTAKDKLLPATLVKSSRSTTYELVATLHSTNLPAERVAIELIMEKFDQLPIWGMFTVHQVLVCCALAFIMDAY